MPNEYGFALCRIRGTQRIIKGPTTWGTPTSVEISPVCPPGSKFVGNLHSHPGGSLEPSAIDLATERKHQFELACIVNETGIRCRRVRK
jgi:hypothetical protein